MKKFLGKKYAPFIMIVVGLIFATVVYAATVSQQPYGIATPYWYGLTARVVSTYRLAFPTLTANDTAVGVAATQTLTNKTLTGPTLTAPVITDPGLTLGISSKSLGKHEGWTLSTAEAKTTILIVSSGSSGGALSIIAPATTGKPFLLRIESGSPQLATATIKVLGGTGVAVAVNKSALVFYDGVDYRRLTADATNY